MRLSIAFALLLLIAPPRLSAQIFDQLEEAEGAGDIYASEWVVQLGAYETVPLLETAWHDIAEHHARMIGGRRIVRGEAVVKGRHYYRLWLAGFDSLREALKLCEQLRQEGCACYVRREDA